MASASRRHPEPGALGSGRTRSLELREPRGRYEREPARRLYVLLVHHDAATRFAAMRAISGDHFVTLASSGEEALLRVTAEHYDVIVSEHRMTEMTGLELLEQVRVRSPFTRRVLLCATDLPGLSGYLASGLLDRTARDAAELAELLETFGTHE